MRLPEAIAALKTPLTGKLAEPPSRPTASKLKMLCVFQSKTVRHSPGGELRAAKSTPEYLVPLFELLGSILQEHEIEPRLFLNCDELGVSPGSFTLRAITAKDTSRADLAFDAHASWLLTGSAAGSWSRPA